MIKYGLLALLTLISPSLLAAVAVVEGVQMPVWVEQDGVKMPLTAGIALQNSDIVSTGEGGRAQLKLAEGSTLKLGQNTRVSLDNLAESGKDFHIAVAVDQGAFRLTSSTITRKTVIKKKLKKGTRKITKREVLEATPRSVNVHLGSINASAQGGDVLGKASDARDVVALLRGNVVVTHDDASQTMLTRSKTFVDALSGGTLNKPRNVPAGDMASWVRETDLIAGHGVVSWKGRWKVSVGTFRNGAEAAELMHKIADEGYAVELAPASISGHAQTRLQVPHFKTSVDAQVIAQRIRKEFDLDSVTVIR
jgi:hypothetical protein